MQALFSSPLGIINIVPLVLYILMSGLAGTDRKRYRIWSKQTIKYGKNVPSQTIIVLLGTVFWYGPPPAAVCPPVCAFHAGKNSLWAGMPWNAHIHMMWAAGIVQSDGQLGHWDSRARSFCQAPTVHWKLASACVLAQQSTPGCHHTQHQAGIWKPGLGPLGRGRG